MRPGLTARHKGSFNIGRNFLMRGNFDRCNKILQGSNLAVEQKRENVYIPRNLATEVTLYLYI